MTTNLGLNVLLFGPAWPPWATTGPISALTDYDYSSSLTPDVASFAQLGPPDVSTTSLGAVFRPGLFFDGPAAGRRPLEAERAEKPPVSGIAKTPFSKTWFSENDLGPKPGELEPAK